MIEVGEWIVESEVYEEIARGPVLAESKEAALMGQYVYAANADGQTPTLRKGWSVTATVERTIS